MRLAEAILKKNGLILLSIMQKELDFFCKTMRGLYKGLNLAFIGDIYFKKEISNWLKNIITKGYHFQLNGNNQNSIAQIINLFQFSQENEKILHLVMH
ncbi:MAG: hypothetical protein IPF69_06650 [Chitinophagaceae bacterium]|nr:hypothetical protein [Chitinophagaceae bacterium]